LLSLVPMANYIGFGGKQDASPVTNEVDPPDLEHYMPKALRLPLLILLLLLLRSDTPCCRRRARAPFASDATQP
jgi:hypothetical protein